VGGAALPVVAPISAVVQGLNALPGNLLRRSRGEEEVKTPTAEDLMRKYGMAIAPQTELGRDFQEGLVKSMDTLKIPAAWPVIPNVPRRPMLTPADVTVGAGQIKQLAKELRETPQDFQAAQSGLKRRNLYGEDTIGVKAQAAADSLGDTLERRRASGLSPIPGVPGVLTPETNRYAVRRKGSRIVQPKVPESAKNYSPEFSQLPDYVEGVYGNVEAGEIPATMIMDEYGPRFLNTFENQAFKGGVLALDRQKAMEMFPDAPDEGSAMRAYELLYSDRNARAAKSLETIEEFLAMPENQRFVEAGIPTPSQFIDRFKEAGRVVKGPLVNYISKNVGAEGDPTVKLARQGITYESPERINELAQYARPDILGMVRTKGGFPAMGSFYEERLAKTGELDKLNEEIAALEDVRIPLSNRANEQGIDPASIPEYAETTNPLRQKMRQRELLQGELENIKLATSMENLSDSAITPKSKAQMLGGIPYQERQFFPSVTKGVESDTFYTLDNSRLLQDIGYQKLGKELVEDILTGKAGDTSKLTIENYMRDKGLSRAEAEKAAKLQRDQYRQSVQDVLLRRIRNDPSVKTFGNAAIITLDKDTPKEVALRDMSADTAVLDHCVGQGCSAAEGKRNPFTNEKQIYEPIIDPVTGELNKNSRADSYNAYVEGLVAGNELVSVRDVRTGLPAATLQFQTTGDVGKFRIGYSSGAKNGTIKPEYIDAIKQYLNSREDSIVSTGENLSDNAGIFDLGNSRGREQAIRAAGIPGYSSRGSKAAEMQRSLELAIQNSPDMPRFVTSDDVKKIFEDTSREVAVVNQPAARATGVLNLPDYEIFVNEFNTALESAAFAAVANSGFNNPNMIEGAIGRAVTTIFDNHLNDPVEFIQDPIAHLLRAERDIQNVIENSRAQGSGIHTELANGLDDFLLDVRGLRGSFERRLQQETDRPAEGSRFGFDADRFGLSLRYNIPPVTVLELQTRFRNPDTTIANLNIMLDLARAGAPRTIFATLPEESRAGAARMISDEIERRQQGAAPVQNQVALQGDPMPDNMDAMDLLRAYDDRMTNEQIRWLERFSQRWEEDVDASPAGQTAEGEMLDEYSEWLANNRLQPDPLANLFDDLEPDPTAVANQPAPRIQVQDPVPREIQTLNARDLTLRVGPEGVSEAQRIAQQYFDDNVFNDDTPVSAATNAIRNYNFGPHEGQPPMVRELAARELEELITTADQDADILVNALDEAMYQDMESPQESMRSVDRDISLLRRRGELAWEDVFGPLAEDYPWSRNTQDRVIRMMQLIADNYGRLRDEGDGEGGQPADNQPRRGPFRPGGASAVRGVPLGNLNIQPAIRADALRGPDSQPVRNFLQQVRGLPGVTQEGLTTGLMAFENMDPNTRMTKAEFVRELLPSSYDIVDLKNAAADSSAHYRSEAELSLEEDPEDVYNQLGLPERYHEEFSEALQYKYGFEDLSAGLKKTLKKLKINNDGELTLAYDKAYESAVEIAMEYMADMNNEELDLDESGYAYSNVQRLTSPSMGDEYGEFGVVHPDQQGEYTHYASAPGGTMGHFRGTHNLADPITLKTAAGEEFETKPGSYVIEEIQSDAQKGTQQKGHLHQVHGILFKAAIQKGLELGADTIYLPTAKVIAKARNEKTSKFAPIYDQAIVKEGLKPLLKIPGVTSKMFNGYHEITFTPEAKEYILNGPGQIIPGYAKGGLVKKPMMPPVITRRHPELAEMQYRYGGLV
jgi:hypothetical protein